MTTRPIEFAELGFEDGELDETPSAWLVPADGWTGVLTDVDAVEGKRCAKLAPIAEAAAPVGILMTSLDATAYRGQGVRLSAKIRVDGAEGRAQMWLRVDRPNGQIGFFDNMDDRPMTSPTWADAVIEGEIDTDAESLALGVMSMGGATVLIDAVRLEPFVGVSAQEPSPPRALATRGVENLAAAARLLAYVRFFHPSDEALAVRAWDHFAVKLMEDVESASDAQELAHRLNKALAPIAASVIVWAGAPDDAPAAPAPPPEAGSVRFWRHVGAGAIASADSIYTSKTATVPLGGDGTPQADGAPASLVVVKSLGGGVSCRLPVAVYVGSDGSLPRPTTPNAWQEPAATRPRLSALNRSTRLAGVAIAWGVMQHFYPYFDVVETDWEAALLAALSDAADDADEAAYLETLNKLIAKLRDGHGQVAHPRLLPTRILPVDLGWAAADLVVTGKHPSAPAEIAVGDAIVAIDGRSVDDRCADLSQRISAATDGWRRARLIILLCRGSSDDTVRLRVRKLDGRELDAAVAPVPPNSIEVAKASRPANGAEITPGILYFDLNGAQLQELSPLYNKLAAASAVVFDLRGYPSSAAIDLLEHLIGDDATSPLWNKPIVTMPDREDWHWDDGGRWELEPQAPRLTGKIAFLTNGVAISYAESIMGIVEYYRLGEIVGSATAGTNGNVNPFALPGGYHVVWTGMQVLKHDGSPHHGVGIQPTIPVEPTAQGIAEGRDEVLEKAVETLQAQIGGAP